MPRYLLTSVLNTIIYILLTTAFGAATDIPGEISRTPIPLENPEAPFYRQLPSVDRPVLQKPPNEDLMSAEISLFPPPYYCEFIDYSGGAFAYYLTIPSATEFDYYNMRFTSEPGYACTLLTVWVAVYPPAFSGTPDLKVVVWDESGFGFPENELASVTVAYEDLPESMGYASADFSAFNLVFEDGENYYVGITTTDQQNNVLAFLLDDGTAGLGRSGFWYDGQFYNRAGQGMTDFNYGIGVDVCCADLPFSECYRQSFHCRPEYYFQNPSEYDLDYFNMRFSVTGPDTLKAVGIALYGMESYGIPDMDVFVWGSSEGFPDLSNVLYQTTIPNADLQYYPDFNHIVIPGEGIVLMPGSDFHVGWTTVLNDPGDILAGLLDDGFCGKYRGSLYGSGLWMTTMGVFGYDHNWLIYADLCRDEFSTCYSINYADNIAYLWSLPKSGTTRTGYYQRFSPGQYMIGCRLERVRFYFYDVEAPAQFTEDIECWVYADDGGLPEPTPIAQVVIPAGDYVPYPGGTEIDFTPYDLLYDHDIWIGAEKHWTSPEKIVTLISDDGYGDLNRSAVHYLDDAGTPDEWLKLSDFGSGWDHNFLIEADVCCISVPPPTCGPQGDWPTCGFDFRRSGASSNTTGDAKCKQQLLWNHNDIAGFVYSRPVIYDGLLIVAYSGKLQAFNIHSGALIWTISGIPYIASGTFRNTVTVHDGYVYFGGGNASSFTKADVYTGDIVWSRSILNDPLAGPTVYTTSVILDCMGTDVIFLGTENGQVYALETSAGANYSGWSNNPVVVDGNVNHTLSSNGADEIYVGTDGAYGDGNGTLYAIDACTGAVRWSLGHPDLAGDEYSGLADPGELLRGPIAVDYDNSLYFMTAIYNDDNPATPSGVYYRVDGDGNILWAKAGQYSYFSGPIIDNSLVYFTPIRLWTSEGTSTEALVKSSGKKVWESESSYNALNAVEGALSCEEYFPDLLYVGNMDGQFLAINTDKGDVMFEYTYANNGGITAYGCGVAIDSSHVVFTNRQGDIYVFGEGPDRPRLRILKYSELKPVPFFSPTSYIVAYDDVFMNNGCANLVGNLTVDENPPAAYAWSVNPERITRMKAAANDLVDHTFETVTQVLAKGQRIDLAAAEDDDIVSAYTIDSYSNMAAYGPPVWLNAIANTVFNLAPDQNFDVVFDVNGPMISRGPHYAYITIATDDDYFLNSTDDPVIQLGVVGGCLQFDDVLPFGVSESNQAPVFNTGEIGNRNGAALWTIEGDDNRYWQGGLFFAADQHRLAWTVDSWHGADPPDFWNSLLPDPNCFDICEPYVTPDPVILGAMSHDGGFTYDDVTGYVSTAAYVDSVVNFDCYGTGWAWDNYECGFDNDLTIGLRIRQFMYGVIDETALANVVIFRHDVTNRNPSPIPGVGIGAFHDYDMGPGYGGFDTWKFSEQYSIAYGSPCAAVYDFTNGDVYGVGKIPMGREPMLGSHTLDAEQAMWHEDNIWLDSIYYYLSTVRGTTAQMGIDISFPCDPASETLDRDLWASFIYQDFAANGTFTFGTYMFGFSDGDITDDQSFYDLAILVNRFAGFDRGDINDDNAVDLSDIVALWNLINAGGPGPLFSHLADVNADESVDNGDVVYLANYYFCSGPSPVGNWVLPDICP